MRRPATELPGYRSGRNSPTPSPIWRAARHPAIVLTYGFAALIAAGAVSLTLPIAQADGRWTPLLDALFTATSAVCVTGLVVVDTGTYWSPLGQAIILALVQVGGLGFMTCSIVTLSLIGRRATLRDQLVLRDALGGGTIGSLTMLARKVVAFTLGVELLGAVMLAGYFAGEMGFMRAAWWGLFHAVSAFNNAGFDLSGGYRSLIPYSHDPFVLLTIAGLVILGGISYPVVEELVVRRRFSALTLNSKLTVVGTLALLVAGTVALLIVERQNDGTLGSMDAATRLLNAFFHSVVARTAGYHAVDVGLLTEGGLLVLIALMFVGGATGSTAGGIKVQTFGLLASATISTIRGHPDVRAFGRSVPTSDVLRAVAVTMLALTTVLLGAFTLNLTERATFLRELFEVVSAFATVGLSAGLTPETTPAGRVLLILLMFAGRLGPLTLMSALAARERRVAYRLPEASVRIG